MVAIESERPDPRIDGWQGQALSFFVTDANDTAANDTYAAAAVHAAVSGMPYCALDGGNVLAMTVGGGAAPAAVHALPHCCRPHAPPLACALHAAGSAAKVQRPYRSHASPPHPHRPLHPLLRQVRLEGDTTFEGAPVRGDLIPGTVLEVLVAHWAEMADRDHEAHLLVHLADSADKGEGTCQFA